MTYRSQFGDTTFTKVFVGGLAWETEMEEMRRYFEQFGDILESVIISDKHTGKSKGYGFVTFRDPESAQRACADPNPVIDGRRANCNIASLGRPRHSPPRGRNSGGKSPFQRTTPAAASSASPRVPPHLPTPPPPPFIYPPYGYTAYAPDYWYYNQLNTTPSGAGSPFYGHPYFPRGMYGAPEVHPVGGSSQLYYPAHAGPLSGYPPPRSFPPATPPPHQPSLPHSFSPGNSWRSPPELGRSADDAAAEAAEAEAEAEAGPRSDTDTTSSQTTTPNP